MKNITKVVDSIISELDGRKGFDFYDLDQDILEEIKDELVKLILPAVGCSLEEKEKKYLTFLLAKDIHNLNNTVEDNETLEGYRADYRKLTKKISDA